MIWQFCRGATLLLVLAGLSLKAAEYARGRLLAQTYCVTCHALPRPEMLDRSTWQAELFPKMRFITGLEPPPTNGYFQDLDRLLAASYFPARPLIPREAFDQIAAFYTNAAPLTLADSNTPARVSDLTSQFTAIPAPVRHLPQLTTLARIDSGQHIILMGDATQQAVDFLTPVGELIGTLPLNNIPVSVVMRPNSLWFGCIGHFFPREEPRGQVIRMEKRPDSFHRTVVASELPRIAHVNLGDLDGDGREDLTVCAFGNLIGRFSWFRALADGSFEERVLLNEPGCLKCEIGDFNGDGRPDLLVLQAQARESLLLFQNEGGGQFHRRVLFQMPPSWGFSDMSLADFDGDGKSDLLICNGDNADFHTSPAKPYHGVRIYLQRPGVEFQEASFLPLNGAYGAVSKDFDGDGDLDIAAVSFFPDFERTPLGGFIYFENIGGRGGLSFRPTTLESAAWGRWLTIDAGDLDQDGDEDLVLGSLVKMPTAVPEVLRQKWNESGPSVLILRNNGSNSAVRPGTRQMGARLEKLASEADTNGNPFMNNREAERHEHDLTALLAAPSGSVSPGRLAGARYRYGVELLYSGATEKALEQFARVEEAVTRGDFKMTPEQWESVRQMHSVAYLRLGEQENCLRNHTSASCLLPIQSEGIHVLQRGSRMAAARLTEDLLAKPDLANGWLLNLAYMTLGEYPDRVPSQFLIPPEVFASPIFLPRFTDIAAGLGLDLNGLAGGVVAEDFDRDGLTDLMISAWGPRDPIRLFRNIGDGGFVERTREAGLQGEVGGLNMIQADYDNDGFTDVFVLRGAWWGERGRIPNSLLRNLGNGLFEDVTVTAGVLSLHPSQAATWFDYNSDGWLDLFIGNESSPTNAHPSELFQNNGDGTFTDVAKSSGLDALGFVKAVASADYDRDGRPDLYLSCRGQPNILYHNDGAISGAETAPPNGGARGAADKRPFRFSNRAVAAGVTEPSFSFATWFFDYDQDGWSDLYVGGYGVKDVGRVAADYLGLPHASERDRLYRNQHDGTFSDVSKSAGVYRSTLPMAGNFGDFDNDGWPDYYLGTGNPDFSMLIPNRAFRNNSGQGFQEVTTAIGMGHLQKGHAIAFADFDNDGDQDLYESIGGAYSGDEYRNVLFQNPGSTNRWLKIRLRGIRSNRDGIGAHLKLTLNTPRGQRVIYKDVNSGGSFGANPLRQELGLADATAIRELEVRWPSPGPVQIVTGLVVNESFEIVEGEREPRPLPAPRVTWRQANGVPHNSPVGTAGSK